MAGAVQHYAYRRPSALTRDGTLLALETSGGASATGARAHPQFFSGRVVRPDIVAVGLRALAAVAGSRYLASDPGAPFRDPVLTCDADQLRCESFSACGGVYARLDILPDGLDGEMLDRGTTNIDIGETLRRMLVKVGDQDSLSLSIGADDVTVVTSGHAVVERRVPLPSRWVRGFAESQRIAASFEPRLELRAPDAARFLRALGPTPVSGWVVPAGRTWRVSGRAVPGAARLADHRRLEHLLPLLRLATRIRVHGPAASADLDSACAAWEVELPRARFVVLLSPHPRRGLSGEGAVLSTLTGDAVEDDADTLCAAIAFRPSLAAHDLAETTGWTRDRTRAALDSLSMSGRVGYDLAEAEYFHRELPFTRAATAELNPRLRAARQLAAQGAVTLRDTGDAEVASGDAVYVVRRTGDETGHCTCPWWLAHRGERGPCKHVLAVDIVRRGDAGKEDGDAGVGVLAPRQ